jgi:hypothetical protein
MVTITIAGVDRTTYILWDSLRIENILNQQADTCSFKIRKYGDRTFKPVVGREVIILDGATRVFGGIISQIAEAAVAWNIIEYTINCIDYTRLLDQHLVAESYENKTITEIITSLIADWLPTGITMTQVDSSFMVKFIQFNYEPATKCINQLADLVGANWYIDYNKDIYFKLPAASPAPTDITDSNGTYSKGSLVVRRDTSQLRNSIVVRGGEYLGTEFTASVRADGTQTVFNLPYRYQSLKATLTGHKLKVGLDYLDNEDDYDVLYNYSEKILRFKEADRPRLNSTLSFGGKPYLPVIVKMKDQNLINAIFSAEAQGDGEYEYLVIDKSINSKEGARQRAQAEMNAYGSTMSEGEFETETAGFMAGQQVLISSASLGINEYFIVNRVVSKMKGLDTMIYQISLITTKTMDFVEILKNIILSQTKLTDITTDETPDSSSILDIADAENETITVQETSTTASITHNTTTETITPQETSTTVQSLNYAVVFVAGDHYVPSTVKRQFIIAGSRLG